MKEQDNTWKGIVARTLTAVAIACLPIAGMEYMFYLKKERDYNYQKESCEAFKKQHPEEEVFFGREVGCKVKHNGYWSRL